MDEKWNWRTDEVVLGFRYLLVFSDDNPQFGGWVESMNQPCCAKALQCGRCLEGESWNFDPTGQWRCTTTPDWWQESLCHWRSYWWSRGHITWVVWEMVMGHGSWCLQYGEYGYAYGSTPMAQERRSNGQVGASCVALVSIPDGVTMGHWSCVVPKHVAWNSEFGVQDKNSAKLMWKCHETRFPKRWIVRMINICGFTISEPIGLIEMGLVMLEFSRSDTRTEGHGSHSDRSGLHPRFSKKKDFPFFIDCLCLCIYHWHPTKCTKMLVDRKQNIGVTSCNIL